MPKYAKVKDGRITEISDKQIQVSEQDRKSGISVVQVDDNAQVGQPAATSAQGGQGGQQDREAHPGDDR